MNRTEFVEHIKNMCHVPTFEEVQAYWDEQVKREEEHWGKDYIYSEWKRNARDKALKEFQEGKPVEFYKDSGMFYHYDSGCCGYGGTSYYEELCAYLYSDGTYKIESYSS